MIHALFEQVVWLDDGAPDTLRLRRIAEPLATCGLDVDEQMTAFQHMLTMPDVNAVLRREFYGMPRDPSLQQALAAAGAAAPLRAVAHNERRFAVRDGSRLLSGIMDRLVLLYDGNRLVAADIIDYKTDAADRDDVAQLDQRVEFYRPQLDAYRKAVATMFHLSPRQICARLLFVSAGVMRAVERDVSR